MPKASLTQQIAQNLATIQKTVATTMDQLRQLDRQISLNTSEFVHRLESQAATLVGEAVERPSKARDRKPGAKAPRQAKQAAAGPKAAQKPAKAGKVTPARAKPAAAPGKAPAAKKAPARKPAKAGPLPDPSVTCEHCHKLVHTDDPEKKCRCQEGG